jgi:hypothetical protein
VPAPFHIAPRPGVGTVPGAGPALATWEKGASCKLLGVGLVLWFAANVDGNPSKLRPALLHPPRPPTALSPPLPIAFTFPLPFPPCPCRGPACTTGNEGDDFSHAAYESPSESPLDSCPCSRPWPLSPCPGSRLRMLRKAGPTSRIGCRRCAVEVDRVGACAGVDDEPASAYSCLGGGGYSGCSVVVAGSGGGGDCLGCGEGKLYCLCDC